MWRAGLGQGRTRVNQCHMLSPRRDRAAAQNRATGPQNLPQSASGWERLRSHAAQNDQHISEETAESPLE